MAVYTVETHYLDVGQGDCSIIVVKNIEDPTNPIIVRTVVIDCGSDRIPEGVNLGDHQPENSPGNILVRRLTELSITQVDVMIISHYDRDHYNGIIEIFYTEDNNKTDFFRSVRIYDMGAFMVGTFKKINRVEMGGLTVGEDSWSNNYWDYVYALHYYNKNKGYNIQRMTERVYCGNPNNFGELGIRKPEVEWKQPPNNVAGAYNVFMDEWLPLHAPELPLSDNPHLCRVSFEPCTYLLGKDLMNFNFNLELPIKLICLAANGHVYNSENQKIVRPKFSSDQKNNFSLGVLLKHHKYTAWFGGDISSKLETALSKSITYHTTQNLTILKAAHHGSNNSTNTYFLEQLKPNTVIITYGETGTHSHPSIETIERLNTEETVKRVLVTSFGIHLSQDEDEHTQRYMDLIQRYREANFPTHFFDPYNPSLKFAIPGSSWEGQPAHILIDNINFSDTFLTFYRKFYTSFEHAMLHSPSDDLGNSLFIDRSELISLVWDEKTNENFLETDKNFELSIRSIKKRDRDDDNDDRTTIKKRKIEMVGDTIEEKATITNNENNGSH